MVMTDLSSSFNRRMVNLWIGLCRGVSGLPRDLFDLGYEDRWIDHKFQNQDREVVNPDLMVASRDEANTLVLEFKSGANTDDDQLRKYARIAQDDLVRGAFIERNAATSHDIVVVGLAD